MATASLAIAMWNGSARLAKGKNDFYLLLYDPYTGSEVLWFQFGLEYAWASDVICEMFEFTQCIAFYPRKPKKEALSLRRIFRAAIDFINPNMLPASAFEPSRAGMQIYLCQGDTEYKEYVSVGVIISSESVETEECQTTQYRTVHINKGELELDAVYNISRVYCNFYDSVMGGWDLSQSDHDYLAKFLLLVQEKLKLT